MVKALILLAALALTGCVSTPPLPSDPRSIWCAYTSPRHDAGPDTPRAELDEINRYNARGVKWCGWKP